MSYGVAAALQRAVFAHLQADAVRAEAAEKPASPHHLHDERDAVQPEVEARKEGAETLRRDAVCDRALEYEVDDTLRDMRTSAHQYRINDTAKSRANRSS